MRVEVTFRKTGTDATRVIEIKAPTVSDALVTARVLLYNELETRSEFLSWGVSSVRKVAP